MEISENLEKFSHTHPLTQAISLVLLSVKNGSISIMKMHKYIWIILFRDDRLLFIENCHYWAQNLLKANILKNQMLQLVQNIVRTNYTNIAIRHKQLLLGNQKIGSEQTQILAFLILISLGKSVPLSQPQFPHPVNQKLARPSLKPRPALRFANCVSNDPNKPITAHPSACTQVNKTCSSISSTELLIFSLPALGNCRYWPP